MASEMPDAAGAPQGGLRGGFPGREGVVTAVDEGAKTLTIAGIPGVTTITVDASLKLTAVKPDGTTQNVALGNIRAGQIVRVRGTIDRSQFPPGQRPDPTKIKPTVTEIIVPPARVANGFGLVTAANGNTVTVVGMDDLTLKVTPAAGATLKKMDGSTFTLADIKPGAHLMFRGTQSGDAISTSELRLLPQGPFGPGGFWRGGPGMGNGPKPPARRSCRARKGAHPPPPSRYGRGSPLRRVSARYGIPGC